MKRVLVGMAGDDHRMDSAANEEIARHFAPPGFQRSDEIIQDAIRDRLVERAFVAVAPQVQLQALQLDAGLIGNIDDADGGEVDRKSTRLNSSHDQISYAVFCLKKKKQKYIDV